MRAGFPVRDRDRIVSRELASRNFSLTAGWVSASSVVSHTEPHHTPSAPSARAAAIWRPLAMPPAASTGVGATASTTSGTSTMVAISPVCPPASVPWATMTSTPAAWWRWAWVTVPARAATATPASCARVMSAGEGAQGARHQRDVVGERHLEQRPVSLGGHVRQGVAPRALTEVGGDLGHVVAAQDVVEELLLGGGEELAHGIGVEAALLGARVVGGEEDVDAVAPAPGLLLDPGQVDVELVRGVGDRPQDSEPARLGDRRDHVPAMAEGQDGELHLEHLGDLGPHVPLLAGTACRA